MRTNYATVTPRQCDSYPPTVRQLTPHRTLTGSAGGLLVWGGLLPPLRPIGRAPPASARGGAPLARRRRRGGSDAGKMRHGCGSGSARVRVGVGTAAAEKRRRSGGVAGR